MNVMMVSIVIAYLSGAERRREIIKSSVTPAELIFFRSTCSHQFVLAGAAGGKRASVTAQVESGSKKNDKTPSRFLAAFVISYRNNIRGRRTQILVIRPSSPQRR